MECAPRDFLDACDNCDVTGKVFELSTAGIYDTLVLCSPCALEFARLIIKAASEAGPYRA